MVSCEGSTDVVAIVFCAPFTIINNFTRKSELGSFDDDDDNDGISGTDFDSGY